MSNYYGPPPPQQPNSNNTIVIVVIAIVALAVLAGIGVLVSAGVVAYIATKHAREDAVHAEAKLRASAEAGMDAEQRTAAAEQRVAAAELELARAKAQLELHPGDAKFQAKVEAAREQKEQADRELKNLGGKPRKTPSRKAEVPCHCDPGDPLCDCL